ncbi:MAG: DUF3782 domain-containing protein [Magnetococcales bacterium]|nr:DUF3782 domain-containing protein [Magnetococcales bacterium]
MPQTATIDDVWEMIRETNRQIQEMAREDRERRMELDRRLQELAQEDRERRAELDRYFRAMREETDRQIAAVSKQMQETDRKLDRLGGRLGEFVEGLVAPACETLFTQRGIPVHEVSRRVKARLPDGRMMEIDLFVVNTDSVVLVEVKSKLEVGDVREHLERLGDFKEFFPRFAGYRVYGAVAAMVMDDNIMRFAINQGLFVIEQTGDTLRMANAADFEPRTW